MSANTDENLVKMDKLEMVTASEAMPTTMPSTPKSPIHRLLTTINMRQMMKEEFVSHFTVALEENIKQAEKYLFS